MSETVGVKQVSRHSAQVTVSLRVGGKVTLHITQGTANEVLAWLEPILVYLSQRAEEEAAV